MKFYLVGIKGTGMSALAQYLHDFNHDVIGSDVGDYYFTEEALIKKNILPLTFNISNLREDYIYIISHAYNDTNIEVQEIKKKGYEYYYYNEFIGKHLNKFTICISGTHGKTTTATFVRSMLNNDISYIIGDGSGGGKGLELLLEACEYKDHFLAYTPDILVITNIDYDHIDYFSSLDKVKKSFYKLASVSKKVIMNKDDFVFDLDNIITFGFNKTSDYVIEIILETEKGYVISLSHNNLKEVFFIKFLGIHMIYNFVAAIIVIKLLNKTPNVLSLELPKRRFERYNYGNTILIDDYAHHPCEISALLNTVKKTYPEYKINAIFEPHTYSRTLKLKKDFKKVFLKFDKVYFMNVFTSKREPFNIYKELLVKKIYRNFKNFEIQCINEISQDKKEIWIFLGAGNKTCQLLNTIKLSINQESNSTPEKMINV